MYVTDSTTLAALIEAEIPRYLPGSRLVLGKVKNRLYWGEINLSHLSLMQTIDRKPFQAARIHWMRVRHDARAMLQGKVVLREVTVAWPVLRLRHRADGTWNLQGLLAESLARPGHADAADLDPERNGRARRVRHRQRGDPPRRVRQDRVGRPEAASVRGDSAGRRL